MATFTPVTMHHMCKIIEEQFSRFGGKKLIQWLPDQGAGRARGFLYTRPSSYGSTESTRMSVSSCRTDRTPALCSPAATARG
jgi:hypothetical protein